MLTLYKNIKARRMELKLTQAELAQRLGYADKSMIAKIEAGQVDLAISKINAFATALHTTPSKLMGDVMEENEEDNIKLSLFGSVDDVTDEMLNDVKRYARFRMKGD